jgi:zinc transport system ATP-binding protein
MSVIASFKHAEIGYGSHPVLHDVSLDINEGAFLLVVGPNGSGKSALIKTLLGVIPPLGGTVTLFDKRTDRFSHWEHVGYLPQSLREFNPLFPATVQEVVSMGLMTGKRQRTGASDDRARTEHALERMGIQDIRDASIGSLSGGQLQRAFIARAIVREPSLLVLDEPNVALDPQAREQFHEYLEGINRENVTILYVTHDVSEIHDCATELLYVDQRILFYGTFKEFCRSGDMQNELGRHAQHHLCHQHCDG